MKSSSIIIGVDFDGTCTTHSFPLIGGEIGAVKILKKLVNKKHKIILFTMRSNGDKGDFLSEAVEWFNFHNIPLFGINENPEQHTWTSSPKPYCHLYIDDASLGCPLVLKSELSNRAYVDWDKVEELLKEQSIL